jgi:CheY-like chemotaxis protein
MTNVRSILLVDSDSAYGGALAAVLRRQGLDVHLASSAGLALRAARRRSYDLAIVDLMVPGGGAELARKLARRIPRLLLSLGAQLERDEIIEAALGFPLCRKAALPARLRAPGVSSNGRASAAKRPGALPRFPVASAPFPALDERDQDRTRPHH